jgi:hypothetical protein
MASSVEREGAREEVVSMELPAPPGWKKKVFLFLYALCCCILLYINLTGLRFLNFWRLFCFN